MLMRELQSQPSKNGIVTWIGIRPLRGTELIPVESVSAIENKGLAGDHYANPGGPRQVTLIQAEHLDAIASFLGIDRIDPGQTRRNIVVRGFNLLSLKGQIFFVGDCQLRYTGDCHPCSRMEKNLGVGGYHAMRGLGGITAAITNAGIIRIGDVVRVVR